MDNKLYQVYTSKEGGQTSYYFTDASTDEIADREALKAASKFFGISEPTIEKIEVEKFRGLPKNAPAAYKWFAGPEGAFENPTPALDEPAEVVEEEVVEDKKEGKKAAPKKTDAANGKSKTKKS